MKQYTDLLKEVLNNGDIQSNRTGIDTISLPGAMMRFDLQEGFPAITNKKVPFKSVMGELVGFLRASRSAAKFRELGCKVWDQNANENLAWLDNPHRQGEDDLGPVYGAQWRQWPAYKVLPGADRQRISAAFDAGYKYLGRLPPSGKNQVNDVVFYKAVDQLRQCLDTIIKDPGSRRILFHGWNWAQIEEMALPPCHLLYQFLVNQKTKELSMCLYIRSNDLGLGAPFNMIEAAALQHLVARLTGYKPRWFTYFIADAHIYVNHVDMVHEMIARQPNEAPQLKISDRVPNFAETGHYLPEWLDMIEPTDFELVGYNPHPAISAPMAV